MFEVRYRRGGEWFPVESTFSAEIINVDAEGPDPSYVSGVGATIDMKNVPKDAEELYCFYHFTDGEDVEDA